MVKIRKMKEEDIDRIVYLEETILGESLGKQMLLDEMNSNITKFYVATIDDVVVGYIGRYAYLDQAEILNLVVDEAYQRMGIGQKLLDQIKLDLPTLKTITLEVRVSNGKAIRFYEKNGFVPLYKRFNYYRNGEDALIYAKEYI